MSASTLVMLSRGKKKMNDKQLGECTHSKVNKKCCFNAKFTLHVFQMLAC